MTALTFQRELESRLAEEWVLWQQHDAGMLYCVSGSFFAQKNLRQLISVVVVVARGVVDQRQSCDNNTIGDQQSNL
jgi:hypothetical protein